MKLQASHPLLNMQASVAEALGVPSNQMAQAPAYQPSAMPDPVTLINPRYTRAPAQDQSMTPLQMFMQARQTGAIPSQQNSFVPWRQPGQSPVPGFGMVDVKVAPGGATSGGK